MSTQPQHLGLGTAQEPDEPGVIDLLKRLTDQGAHLAQQQVALVRTEIQESVDDLKGGVVALAAAAVVGMAGLGVVLLGIAYFIATWLDLWLATLLVGVAALVVAVFLFEGAKKKMSAADLSPRRTKQTLKRAPQAAAGNL